MPQYDGMVCLVGENALPVYLGVRQLTGPGATVWLVHSPATLRGAQRIRELFADREVKLVRLDDPWDPGAVVRVVQSLPVTDPEVPVALNYTGGTKVMSAFAVQAWTQGFEHTWYLEEARGLFHNGIGATEALGDIGLSARDLCALHGISLLTNAEWAPDPATGDLRRLLLLWCSGSRPRFQAEDALKASNPKAAFRRYRECAGDFGACLDALTPQTRERWSALPKPSHENEYGSSKCRRIFEFFADNQWLEYLVREIVLCLPRGEGDAYQFGVHPPEPLLREEDLLFGQDFTVGRPSGGGGYDPTQFEGDLLAVVGNRLRYVSVTTAWHPAACKEKMFEAMHRARQIGGDLATTCVVSLAEPSRVSGCLRSIAEGPRHTIFGERDVNAWPDNPGQLREFMTRDFR